MIISLSLFCLSCFSQQPCKHNMTQKLNADTVLFLCDTREMYKLFEQNVFDTLSIPCDNEYAIKIFEGKIAKLKLYIKTNDGKLLDEINNIMWNFVLLTNIESEIKGDWAGILFPTNKDIERWEEWFQEHKDRICWYEQKNILFLKKAGY